MEEIDVRLSSELDRGGDLTPLLTFAEARVARFALHMLSQGDGPGATAARDLVARLDRRFEVQFPGESVLFGDEMPECGRMACRPSGFGGVLAVMDAIEEHIA
ncbi:MULTISPECIES: hypothetical protein [unclassified Streptomyces]|uniref:hypothetical protein n=1 Tax=unclassified Streptomyces TaxID=2593676 RepID=UPI00278C51A5|nr:MULTISPECIES: hypothetical protein [unclassified Streptomyces]